MRARGTKATPRSPPAPATSQRGSPSQDHHPPHSHIKNQPFGPGQDGQHPRARPTAHIQIRERAPPRRDDTDRGLPIVVKYQHLPRWDYGAVDFRRERLPVAGISIKKGTRQTIWPAALGPLRNPRDRRVRSGRVRLIRFEDRHRRPEQSVQARGQPRTRERDRQSRDRTTSEKKTPATAGAVRR